METPADAAESTTPSSEPSPLHPSQPPPNPLPISVPAEYIPVTESHAPAPSGSDPNPLRSELSGEPVEVSNPNPGQLGLEEELLNSPIDEKMEKVALLGGSDDLCGEMVDSKMDEPMVGGVLSSKDVGEAENGEEREEETESDVESSEETENEESSTASSSEEEDECVGGAESVGAAVEMEEGERAVFSDDEEEEVVAKGSIKSKYEIDVLPPVPRVEVLLEPHHQTSAVGVILFIVGNKVIVEGSVNHNPLTEGSILWITDSRLPLGIVDEIFGPVKNPYYVVRYNYEEEIPIGISEGMGVSFVAEFANHILNMKDLQKKGYDASGENDEEVTDEVEFSDDEKEAEYRRSQRQAKRGTEERRPPKQKYVANKKTNFKGFRIQEKMQAPVSHDPTAMVQRLTVGHSPCMEPSVIHNSAGNGNSFSFGGGQALGSMPSTVPVIPQTLQPPGGLIDMSHQFMQQQPNALWAPVLLPQQQSHVWLPEQQTVACAYGLPPQQQHMNMHHAYMMSGFPNQQISDHTYHNQHSTQGLSSYSNTNQFQQLFIPNPGGSSNMPWLGGPMNYPISSLSAGGMGPGGFTQLPGDVDYMHNLGVVGLSNLQNQVHAQQLSLQGGMHPPSQFNLGSSTGRGSMPNARGGRLQFGRSGQQRR